MQPGIGRRGGAVSDDAAALLRRAAETLDDARLLAERRRRNEAVLTRLALHQALRAISLREGLEADDALRLDTLLRRVPPDHPQAELVAHLGRDGARTIAAVAELVEALSRPQPKPAPKAAPDARPAAARSRPGPGAGPADATALGSSPRGEDPGHAGTSAGVASAAFWTLMDRWRVPDGDALALIGHAGGLTRKGGRPRFRLRGAEAERYAVLRALDGALDGLELDPPRWLATPQRPAPFGGATPLDLLRRDPEAARRLLRALRRQGLAATLAAGGASGPGP